MILTYKIKHNHNFSSELKMARKVAEFSLKTKSISSKDVRHIGLKSAISNQILKKYSRNKKLKRVGSVKLTVPNQGIKVNQEARIIKIPCLKLELQYQFPNNFTKINQIEIDNEYAYISVTILEQKQFDTKEYIGIDRNATSHIAVCSLPNGKVMKLGKKAQHIRNKYKNIRKQLQHKGKFKKLKAIKRRESRIIRDINHKISRTVVDKAKESGLGIKLENLEGIRKTAKVNRKFKGTLHSWSFYQLEQFIEYKAKLLGVPVIYVDPYHTSKSCSKCGLIGTRNGKKFVCHSCGYVEHADVNASFNIAKASPLMVKRIQSIQESVCMEGNTDIPQKDMVGKIPTLEPHDL